MTALLSTRGLRLGYQGSTVLRDVDFDIHPGEIVTVVGPNGSGKSSFLRALIGALPPAGGEIQRKAGLRLGYVPQRLTLDPSLPLSVKRFMDLPTRNSRAARDTALAEAGASHYADRQMAALSGGQRQRVLLARALLNAPEILLLDEPTQGLDQPGQAEFYRKIEDLRDSHGCAVLLVSHELHVVMSASDRVICLNGHICCQGHPEVVAQAEEYRALFGTGTGGALALYRHQHNHRHHEPAHVHSNDGACCADHDATPETAHPPATQKEVV
ncbi:MAG: metal ABC transporter ATP-binding protein [Pelagimonas sp.]|jgi:zinc transport system ATP-binding protein|nr:metal ABC transporter ATP-binding protein [Pelagimonas sp.]